ncbi:MAG: ABC transporter permease subunit [Chitinivibrionales bacterium]|nr:ABC transporter permease subunit [Chitinivibrionales bacterium]
MNDREKKMGKKKALSDSLLKKRWKKFRTLKRSYFSLLFLIVLYILSFLSPLLINNKALVVYYHKKIHFPAFGDLGYPYFSLFTTFYSAEYFGMEGESEAHYRVLHKKFREEKIPGQWLIMPPYQYHPNEHLLNEITGKPPTRPDRVHWLGTDNRGRDVFARLMYGFNISMTFAIIVTLFGYFIGVIIGGVQGFFGGRFDIYFQRFIEVFASLPFLYIIMIAVSLVQPSFMLLTVLMIVLSSWIGISYYIRSEFYREKAKDYIAAAISMGASTPRVMFKHILPNSLTPIITLAPFSIISGIYALVGLDYLGFGLAPPTPSWGELAQQGVEEIRYWWLIVAPIISLFITLLTVSFIGEGVREAFDPKIYSRLR